MSEDTTTITYELYNYQLIRYQGLVNCWFLRNKKTGNRSYSHYRLHKLILNLLKEGLP